MKVPIVFLALSTALAASQPGSGKPRVVELDDASITVAHPGDPDIQYAWEATDDLVHWKTFGPSREDPDEPGTFRFVDRDRLYYHLQRFYRVRTDVDPAVLDWMENYADPVDNLPHLPFDIIRWQPFPLAGVDEYQLDFYAVTADGDGGHAVIPRPLHTVEGLVGTSFHFSEDLLPLTFGKHAFSVSARVGGRTHQGRPVVFESSYYQIGGEITGPNGGMSFEPRSESPAEDWNELIRRANELHEKKQETWEALQNNPLVEDVALFEQLMEIMQNWDDVKEFVLELLEDQIPPMDDAETAKTAICVLHNITDFLLRNERDMRRRDREALTRLRDGLGEIKDMIEEAENLAEAIGEAREQLESLIGELRQLFEDPFAYLVEQARERLLERIRERLVRRFGESIVPVFSILNNLVNFADALIKADSIEALCREINRMILLAIASQPSIPDSNANVFFTGVPEEWKNCSFKLTFRRVCFVPTEGGLPNEGEFQEFPLPIAGGDDDGSKTYKIDGFLDDNGNFVVRIPLDSASLTCPDGAGPCYIVVYWELVGDDCPPLSGGPTLISGGAIHCN